MAEVVIRRAENRDEDALLRLAGRLAGFELPEWRNSADVIGADAQAMLAAARTSLADDDVFVAETGDQVVGCLHVMAATDFFGLRHAHVSVIAASAAAEGSGVGRALLAHAEEWGRLRGLPLLTLNAFANNTRARLFYERAGMTVEFVKYAKAIPADRL
ncbi:MAG: GNAT family N-acetyltransferase [Vicinamibacterales bacterium]